MFKCQAMISVSLRKANVIPPPAATVTLIDCGQPERFVKDRECERSFLDVSYETVKRLSFGKLFSLEGFQFVSAFHRLTVAFKVTVVALIKVTLSLGSSSSEIFI